MWEKIWKTTLIGIIYSMISVSAQPIYAGNFILTSPQLVSGNGFNQEQVLNGFGCKGRNISPELHWSGEPARTRSFGVTIYDPDAPTGSGWWHWLVVNIPATTHSLAPDSGNPDRKLLPGSSLQIRTDFGKPGYGGPCPPTGDTPHHYVVTVWALDTEKLPVDPDSSGAMVGFFLHQHLLTKAEIILQHGR